MTPYRHGARRRFRRIVVEFDERIDPVVNAAVIALAGAVQAAPLPGVRDVVPTYRSVAIYFDPLRTDGDALAGAARKTRRSSCRRRSSAAVDAVPDSGLLRRRLRARSSRCGGVRAAWTKRMSFERTRTSSIGYSWLASCRASRTWASSTAGLPCRVDRTPRVRVPAGSVGDCRRANRHLSSGNARRLAADWPDAAEAVRSASRRAVSDEGRRRRAVLSHRRGRSTTPGVRRDRRPATGSVRVISPGLLTTIQDEGRWGFQVAGRAGGGSDGSRLASAGERPCRQRPRCGDARGDASSVPRSNSRMSAWSR